jgi:flagellar hook-basal body complex protein FliE
VGEAEGAAGGSFRSAMADALKNVSRDQMDAQRLQKEFSLDNPTVSLEQTMVAMQKSQIGFQAAVQVRNRLLSAYTDIMNMQVKESGAMLKKAVAGFANRTLSGLRLLDLTAAVQRLADRPNTAAKSLALLKQFTGWCKARGLMDIDPLSGVTAKHLGMQAYEPRERVLTPDELRDLWRRADTDARVLKFCALTACRIGEALQWQAGQVVDGVWTIPMTKNGKAHVLPLSPAAIALLPLPGTPPAYTSMIQRMKAAGLTWRPHDIRRTAATLMRSAGVPVHDIEATLNHDAPKLVRVYQRHDPLDEKRAALVALAKRLDETVKGAK